MHKPSKSEIESAERLATIMKETSHSHEVGERKWELLVLMANAIDGWLHCARAKGETRRDLKTMLSHQHGWTTLEHMVAD